MAGIESLFGKINCDRASIDDLLGAQSGVTDQNMLQYLGIVEERTNQLLLVQAYLTSQKVFEAIFSSIHIQVWYEVKPANLNLMCVWDGQGKGFFVNISSFILSS